MGQGRVELLMDGEAYWGLICDDGWSIEDARVVCRMLGYQWEKCTIIRFYRCFSDAIRATTSSLFGGYVNSTTLEERHPFYLSNLQCSGAEATLLQCGHSGWRQHQCDGTETAGVVCQVLPEPQEIENGKMNVWWLICTKKCGLSITSRSLVQWRPP